MYFYSAELSFFMMCLNIEASIRMKLMSLLSYFAELSFFMMHLNVEVSMRMKLILLLSMSLFDKFRLSFSFLLSKRLLTELSFFTNCLMSFVVEVSVRIKLMSLSLMSLFGKFKIFVFVVIWEAIDVGVPHVVDYSFYDNNSYQC